MDLIQDSTVTGIVKAHNHMGGLVGENKDSATISRSCSFVEVSPIDPYSQGANVGGLVGRNTGKIEYSCAMGDVEGREGVGGLVGINFAQGNITYSYATGMVTGRWGSRSKIGGLVGYNIGTIRNSYAAGSVSGKESVGGLVGYFEADNSFLIPGKIESSYAVGKVTAEASGGGLVGVKVDGKVVVEIISSFYDKEATGKMIPAKVSD